MQKQSGICWSMHPGCNMKVYTITLNPAYDVHAYAEHFTPYHENLAHIRSKEAGGKGLNVTRALLAGQVPNTAVIVLGTENGADYRQYLSDTGVDCLLFEQEGRIRENLTLHCADSPETRISFAGFRLDATILGKIREALAVDGETIVTFTGRVPDGVGMAEVKDFLQALKDRGAKIVLDSRSFTLEDMYEVRPWLIKPNQEEIAAFFNCPVETVEDAIDKAKQIAAHGITNVMISLGGEGALLLCDGKLYHGVPAKIEPLSTIGAGDSSIAGFIAAAIRGETPAQCLCSAVAFGTAACLTEGTLPPSAEDIAKQYRLVAVSEAF